MHLKRIFILFVVTVIASPGSRLLAEEIDLTAAEAALIHLLQKRSDAAEWEDRERFEKEFEAQFLLILKQRASFKYPFSQLPIQSVDANDGKLKIYTWDTTLGGTWHNFAGIIQWFDDANNLNAKLLEDESALLDPDLDATQNKWIGAIYAEVHPLRVNQQTCYLALGWTTWGNGTQAKMVEIFTPHGPDVSIGKPIFQFEGQRRVRLFFEYARWETMHLEYNPATQVLKFDNLIAASFEPDGEGLAEWRKPDGTTRILKFTADCFKEIKP